MLEDLGFYCIDNIPAALLKPFISYTVRRPETTYERTAVGLDARNTAAEVASVPELVDELKRSGLQCEVIFSPLRLSSSTSSGTLALQSAPLELVDQLERSGLQCEVIFLIATE